MRYFPKMYAAINKDERIRNGSSSGGVFYLLSEYILKKGGVVFGVEFDENYRAVHSYTSNIEDIKNYQGSKYVQSAIGKAYQEVEKFLSEGKLVLFSGTPCQNNGLYSYLGKKEQKNLILVDFICHGVPSPEVWKRYLKERAAGKSIASISFRDKMESWQQFSLKIQYKDGSSYHKNQYEDVYMKGFLSNIFLRPSCYHCQFKGISRCSDITMADFWGVDKQMVDMYDEKGTSFIMIHSTKGSQLWESVSSCMKIAEVDETALDYNTNAIRSVECPEKRSKFMNLKQKNVIYRTEKLTRRSIQVRIKSKCKNIIKKIFYRI